MKRTFLIWIIVILATLNIGTITTLLLQRNQSDLSAFENIEKIEIPKSRLGRFFREELNLNQQQHIAFREYRQKFHIKASQITMQMQQKRKEMMLELQKENSDSIVLHSIAKELGELHEQLKHATFEYYLSMKKQCNKEQQKKLFAIFYNISNANTEVPLPHKQMKN